VIRTAVITGLGAVSAAGCGRAPLADAFRTSSITLTPVDRSAGYHRLQRSRLAALVGAAELGQWIAPLVARRMSQSSRWAVSAARMALADASLELDPQASNPVAVVMSTAYGAAAVTEKMLRQVQDEGPEAASPALFTESVANAPAAQVALAVRAVGANITVTQRQAGPLIALGTAAQEVIAGRAECALVGSVDELSPLIHSILDRFGALAPADANGHEAARPFDRRRSGFLAGEGATVVVLEEATAARRRGARALAEVDFYGSAFDPQAPRTDWSRDPSTLVESLSRLLERHDAALDDFECVVSGACGSTRGDRLEALVLEGVWGERRLPPVLAPKALTGEHGGGLLAAAVLAAAGAEFGPTPGFREVDPELGLAPFDGSNWVAPGRLLVSCLATGGAAAWAMLTRAGQ